MLQIGSVRGGRVACAIEFDVHYGVRYDIQKVAQPSTTNPAALTAGFTLETFIFQRMGWNPGSASPIRRWATRSSSCVRAMASTTAIRRRSCLVRPFRTTAERPNAHIFNIRRQCSLVSEYEVWGPVDNPSCQPPAGGASTAPIIFVVDPNYKQPFCSSTARELSISCSRVFRFQFPTLAPRGITCSALATSTFPSQLPAIFW